MSWVILDFRATGSVGWGDGGDLVAGGVGGEAGAGGEAEVPVEVPERGEEGVRRARVGHVPDQRQHLGSRRWPRSPRPRSAPSPCVAPRRSKGGGGGKGAPNVPPPLIWPVPGSPPAPQNGQLGRGLLGGGLVTKGLCTRISTPCWPLPDRTGPSEGGGGDKWAGSR